MAKKLKVYKILPPTDDDGTGITSISLDEFPPFGNFEIKSYQSDFFKSGKGEQHIKDIKNGKT